MTHTVPLDAQFQITFISGADAGCTKYYKTAAAVNAAMKRISRQNAQALAVYYKTPITSRVDVVKIAFIVGPVSQPTPVGVDAVRI